MKGLGQAIWAQIDAERMFAKGRNTVNIHLRSCICLFSIYIVMLIPDTKIWGMVWGYGGTSKRFRLKVLLPQIKIPSILATEYTVVRLVSSRLMVGVDDYIMLDLRLSFRSHVHHAHQSIQEATSRGCWRPAPESPCLRILSVRLSNRNRRDAKTDILSRGQTGRSHFAGRPDCNAS